MVEAGAAPLWQPSSVGVSFKNEHHHAILEATSFPSFFEIITENYMNTEGFPLQALLKTRENTDFTMHGVSLSLGSQQLARGDYLKNLKTLASQLEPRIISDHLCWTGTGRHTTHDLLPFPFSEESLAVVVRAVHEVQDALKRPFTVENVSRYIDFRSSTMDEIDFFQELIARTGCTVLLDINNVYVNSVNFRFDPEDFINRFPADSVVQYHIAGHSDRGDFLYDTHVGPVPDPVVALYQHTLKTLGSRPTLLEWDSEIPPYAGLIAEAQRLTEVAHAIV